MRARDSRGKQIELLNPIAIHNKRDPDCGDQEDDQVESEWEDQVENESASQLDDECGDQVGGESGGPMETGDTELGPANESAPIILERRPPAQALRRGATPYEVMWLTEFIHQIPKLTGSETKDARKALDEKLEGVRNTLNERLEGSGPWTKRRLKRTIEYLGACSFK